MSIKVWMQAIRRTKHVPLLVIPHKLHLLGTYLPQSETLQDKGETVSGSCPV